MTIEEYFTAEYLGEDFLTWGKEINRLCEDATGLSLLDLPDENFAEMFEDGLTAQEAWGQIAEENGYI